MERNFDEYQIDIEMSVCREMGLPANTLSLDGDRVLINRKDVRIYDEEREQFKFKVKQLLWDAINFKSTCLGGK